MIMETHFFLSRHGETQWNKIKKLQGQLDSPLTDTGLIQANNIARYLKAQSIDLIVSPPLKRAFDTAKRCQQQLKCPIRHESNLMEHHIVLSW
ncbi:MAG: broad specificity phosphatase PhoE [Alteromonadaceae bacterium]|jgi:broad specificity phosphatase PhoE